MLAKMVLWLSQVISESGAGLGTSKDEERDQLRREVSCVVGFCSFSLLVLVICEASSLVMAALLKCSWDVSGEAGSAG
jgi:hypothetical protein